MLCVSIASGVSTGMAMRKQWAWLMGLAIAALIIVLYLSSGSGWLSTQVAAQEPEMEIAAPSFSLSGTYDDPQNRFQVGIVDGFTVSTAGGAPLFQAPDGSLAYSVVVTPLDATAANPLPDVALLQATEVAFGKGEGFQTSSFQAMAGGGLQIDWTGRFTQGGGPPQPVAGKVLTKQQGEAIFMLMVAALESGQPLVLEAINSLADTLVIP
jgi:hypothetical protein